MVLEVTLDFPISGRIKKRLFSKDQLLLLMKPKSNGDLRLMLALKRNYGMKFFIKDLLQKYIIDKSKLRYNHQI